MDGELSHLAASAEKAVETFYSSSDAISKEQSHQLLKTIRESQWAGQLAWHLLSDPSKPPVTHFFAATALREHVTREWRRMSIEQQQQFQEEIFKVLALYCRAERFLHVQLCVTAADILLCHGSGRGDNVVDIVAALKSLETTPGWQSEEGYNRTILGLLTVVPEEFSSLDMPGEHRNALRCSLGRGVPTVLELLNNCLRMSSPSPEAMSVVLKCFTSWAKFGIPLNEMQPLLDTFMQVLRKEELCEDAVELLHEVVLNGDSHRFPKTVRYFLSLVVSTYSQFEEAAARGATDFCKSMARLISTVGESHSKMLLEWPSRDEMDVAHQFLKYAVLCSTLPGRYPMDEECSECMLSFWHRFSEEVEKLDKVELKRMLWTAVYCPLLLALISKIEIPSGAAQTDMCASDEETFYSFRSEALDAVTTIGGLYFNETMDIFHTLLEQQLSSSEQPCPWQPAEAVINALRTCAEPANHLELQRHDSQQPSQGLELLGKIFREHIARLPMSGKLRQTLYRLFSAYADWINNHSDLVGPVLSMLVEEINENCSPSVMLAAVSAIAEICSECQNHVVPFLDQLATVCHRPVMSRIPKCQLTMMKSVCIAISTLPAEHCVYYTQQFTTPHLEHLQQLASAEMEPSLEEALLHQLGLVKTIFYHIDPEIEDFDRLPDNEKDAVLAAHPIRIVVTSDTVWQTFNLIVVKWMSCGPVIQVVCDILRRLILRLHNGIFFQLHAMQALLVQLLDVSVLSYSLDVSIQLLWHVKCVADSPPGLKELVMHYAPLLSMLTADPSANPDVTQAFLQMLCRVLKCLSDWIFSPGAIFTPDTIFGFLQVAMSVAEQSVVEVACTTMVAYIDEVVKRNLMDELWESSCGLMVGNLLSALMACSPGRKFNSLCSVFFALYRHCPLLMKAGLDAIFSSIAPFTGVANWQKEKLFKALPRERNNKRAARDGLSEFLRAVQESSDLARAAAVTM